MKNLLTICLGCHLKPPLRRSRVLALLLFLLSFSIGRIHAQTACSASWVSSAVYTRDGQVSRGGNNYVAKWWTQGEDPVTTSCTDCVWRLVGPCGGGGTNTPPTVGLTAPANGATYAAPATLQLSANATDNGAVARVEFFGNGTKVGEALTAPYTYSWTGVGAGTYAITARATDNAGLATTSAAVTVSVTSAQTGAAIPGKIEAEAYVAMSGVQLESTTDTDGGQNVGYIDAGDWLDYAVNVAAAGTYTVTYRVASLAGGSSIQLRAGAVTLATSPVPATGGWQTWTSVPATVTLAAGQQTLRLQAAAGGFNVNWLQFTAASGCPASTIAPSLSVGGGAQQQTASTTVNVGTAVTLSPQASTTGGSWAWSTGAATRELVVATPAAGTFNYTATYTNACGAATQRVFTLTVNPVTPNPNPTTGLPGRIMSGYWHNFGGGVPFIRLRDVNPGWDVINISFAEPVVVGSTDGRMKFVLGGPADYTSADFKADIRTLQGRGKKIVLSIGGYEGYFSLGSAGAVTQFVGDIKGFVNEYGFDGIDIDLEQSSVQFNSGADPDFRNPTSPKVVNMISAIRQIVNAYPASSFILSWAPETFYFPMARQWYGGINSFVDSRSGVYLPMIHALRDRTTYVQTQLYNSAQMQGNDGVLYSMGTVEGIVAMTEMIIQGFTVGGNASSTFPGLRPDQVVVAVPSSQGAAGSGQISNASLQTAFNQVNARYPGLRGIMAWSINWDAYQNGNSFVTSNSQFLRGLPATARVALSDQPAAAAPSVYPNPALAGNRLRVDLGKSCQQVEVVLTDLSGLQVAADSFRGVRHAELTIPRQAKGTLLLRVVADGRVTTSKIVTE
ncbi:MAG: carbohydrate-binding protein [Hymenobacter sp.]|nr:carbohydrate-binding protein [Hymenobacter sp.]